MGGDVPGIYSFVIPYKLPISSLILSKLYHCLYSGYTGSLFNPVKVFLFNIYLALIVTNKPFFVKIEIFGEKKSNS